MTVDSQSVSVGILYEIVRDVLREAALPAFYHETQMRELYGKAERVTPTNGSLTQRNALCMLPGRDIYGKEKSTETQYLDCPECARQIAGQRFAAHVARCVKRR